MFYNTLAEPIVKAALLRIIELLIEKSCPLFDNHFCASYRVHIRTPGIFYSRLGLRCIVLRLAVR